MTPTRLGPYEILAPIGRGGMGEVFRARDARLDREVAIKVSSERFSDRFEREAKTIASLNHPNICSLHDVGPNYLVMELVDGETLADRLKQGPLPLREALNIARQIADALDAAHERGIVHRDVKPGNVKIKPDGVVKVLDFGLAKMGGTPTVQSDNSPTLSMHETEAGMILGTAAYMSPEQAKGKTVDKRADIYAFGAVVYEMLTGDRLHQGETTTELLASVIKEEPKWDRVPMQVQRLLRRCLEKDPQQRLRHIGDVMSLVDEPGSVSVSASPTRSRRFLWLALAVLGVLVAGFIVMWAPWQRQSNLQAIRFEIPSNEKLTFITGAHPAVSPDGRWVVFPATDTAGVTRMWLRALDSVEVRPLIGTESPNNLPPPVFWSADSRYITFGSTSGPYAPGQLKKLSISGGPPQTICDVPAAVPGGTWNSEGIIVFGHNATTNGLMRVSAAGGIATPVTMLDRTRRETRHSFPQFLPDGRHFLYFRASPSSESMGIYVGSIDAKPEEQPSKPLLITQRQGVYAPSPNGRAGYLLFLRDTTLFAQPFDPEHLQLSGEPVPVADQVGSFAPANAGLFSVSDTGVLAYRVGLGGTLLQLTWFDPTGNTKRVGGEAGSYLDQRISPDETRVAFSRLDSQSGNSNIWLLDLARGTNTRLTFNVGADRFPVWSPDGKRIAFGSNRDGVMNLYQKTADGSGEETLLLKSERDKAPMDWSRDERFLLYTEQDPKAQSDIWVLPLEGDRKPIPFLRTEFNEAQPRFSPDAHWIAYQSSESGNPEIYVRPFSPGTGAATGGKWMISKGGAGYPRWRNDGKQIFYIQGSAQQMAVEVTADTAVRAGQAQRLFTFPGLLSAPDVTPDGKRFLFALPEGANVQTPMTVVLNWQSALKK